MELASKGQLRASYLRWAVVTVPFLLLLGFAAARIVPTGSENCWYRALAKPVATPPDWAFPVAWTAIYVLLGLALAMIVNARGARGRGAALGLFAAQLVLNLAWSPLFFGAHQLFWSLVTVVVMFGLAVLATFAFGRIRPVAAWLLVPYLAWLCVAGLLTVQLLQLNPDADRLACAAARTQITL